MPHATSIYDSGLDANSANYVALSPLSFAERTAAIYPEFPAVVYGDIRDGRNVPVRMQIESVLDDAFGASDLLARCLKDIAGRGRGVVVYLREGSVGVAHVGRRAETVPGHENHMTAEARKNEWLEIGLGAQILRDLGIQSIDLIASRERHYVGLEGFGIQITKTDTGH